MAVKIRLSKQEEVIWEIEQRMLPEEDRDCTICKGLGISWSEDGICRACDGKATYVAQRNNRLWSARLMGIDWGKEECGYVMYGTNPTLKNLLKSEVFGRQYIGVPALPESDDEKMG